MASLSDNSANQLNRELLRWIQSLDLAYSIKNVKRDFSNGFLVAEIMSRYYDKDISMHSYDNGIGVKVKKDNWDQLHRVFCRISDLESLTSRAEMEAVIHCANGAAVAFVTKLYQCLTKRTIQPSVAPSASASASSATPSSGGGSSGGADEIPPYAKPTGAAVIRDRMRGADIAAASDETEINRKVRGAHSQHEEQLQLERLLADPLGGGGAGGAAPSRYPSLRSASKATVLRSATKPVRNDESPLLSTHQVVKEVQIKSMNEKGLEKLRMNREAKESDLYYGGGGSSPSATTGAVGVSFDHYARNNGTSSSTGGGGGGGTTNSAGELIQRRRPMDLLNEAVSRKLPAAFVAKMEQQRGKEKFECFVDALLHDSGGGGGLADAPEDEEQEANATTPGHWMAAVLDDAPVLAQAFLEFPKDFWKFCSLVFPFLWTESDGNEDAALFVSVHHALVCIGKQCAKRDATSAMALANDYLMPKLAASLAQHTTKRAPMLEILYAFSADTPLAHLQTIKRLREALASDLPLFIHALSILLYMEKDGVRDDATLVDLYYYYCCIGLETPCEKLRAACLSMLVVFVQQDVALVVDLLPRLTQFSTRFAWWEVKTQLLIVASAFLQAVAASSSSSSGQQRDYTEQIELALTIIENEFHPSANLNLRRVGLSYLAKNLAQYQELVPLYVDVLLSLPLHVRSTAMLPSTNTSPEIVDHDTSTSSAISLPIRGTSGAHYALLPLARQWDSVTIAKQIFYERKARDHADVDAMQVLSACFVQLTSQSNSQRDASALYDQMRGYLVLGLLDAGACGVATQLFLDLMACDAVAPQDVLCFDGLVDTLQLLVTRNVDDIRQQSAVKMLHDAFALGPRHGAAVEKCVHTLATRCDASTFKASLFAIALDEGRS